MEQIGEIDKFVGLDVGQENMEAVWLHENGNGSSGSLSFTNDHSGYEEFLGRLKRLSSDDSTSAVGVEGHDGYLSPLDEYLRDEGYPLISVHPLRIKRYKDMLGQPKKSDHYDAYAIADFLKSRKNQLMNLPRFKTKTQILKKLSRTHKDLKKQVNRYTSKLQQVVNGYLPELIHLDEFPSVTSKTAINLLNRYPTREELLDVELEELTKFIKSVSRGQCGKEAALAVREGLGSIRRSPKASDASALRTKTITDLLLTLEKRCKEIKKKIGSLLEGWETAQIVLSLPGAGDLLVGRLLGEIVTIERFKSADALALYCGVAPVPHSSGSWQSDKSTHQVNHWAKDALMQMARCSKKHGKESKEYYEKKRKEGKSHWHAIKCLARQLIRVIYAMLRDRTYYQPGQ